jgi:hypothetical protein
MTSTPIQNHTPSITFGSFYTDMKFINRRLVTTPTEPPAKSTQGDINTNEADVFNAKTPDSRALTHLIHRLNAFKQLSGLGIEPKLNKTTNQIGFQVDCPAEDNNQRMTQLMHLLMKPSLQPATVTPDATLEKTTKKKATVQQQPQGDHYIDKWQVSFSSHPKGNHGPANVLGFQVNYMV